MTKPVPEVVLVQACVTDAIAQVRQAMMMAEHREISHGVNAGEPCDQANAAEDAAFRNALQQSEDAMLDVLETLPPISTQPDLRAN